MRGSINAIPVRNRRHNISLFYDKLSYQETVFGCKK
jgi:hypothetical protein